MKIRIFEAFAGYGSQSIALQRLKEDYPGFDYEVAGFSEIDRFAVLASGSLFSSIITRRLTIW